MNHYIIKKIEKIDSTNTELKRLASLGEPSGTVLLAHCQTAGRGRLGRQFFSPAGSGIYMSLLLRPVSLENAGLITTMAAVAVARALEKIGVSVGIKWVNDLLFDGKKLCGILAEAGNFNGQPFAVIGIGINVKKTTLPQELVPIAISLEDILKTVPEKDVIVSLILDELAKIDLQDPSDTSSLMDEYRNRSLTVSRWVDVLPHHGEPYRAFAEHITDDGSLLVRTENGTQKTVSSGEVSVRADDK